MSDIPYVVVDWDYQSFGIDDDNKTFTLYDLDWNNLPKFVFIEGWPTPGWRLEPTLAKLVGEEGYGTYKLIDPKEKAE